MSKGVNKNSRPFALSLFTAASAGAGRTSSISGISMVHQGERMIVRFNVCLCVEGDHVHVGFDECVATVEEEEGGETTRSVWIVPVSGWMDKGS